jgi:hypothetical protein
VEVLDEAITDTERDEASARLVYDRALEARAGFVERNRDRLVKVAEQEKLREHRRYMQLVDELEESRANLLELRQSETWARLFPGEEASLIPHNENVLVGATAKPVERAIQIKPAPRLEAPRVFPSCAPMPIGRVTLSLRSSVSGSLAVALVNASMAQCGCSPTRARTPTAT